MDKKILVGLVAFCIVIGIGVAVWILNPTPDAVPVDSSVVDQERIVIPATVETPLVPLREGTYAVLRDESVFTWSGKKPLIDGYVNTGSIAFTDGALVVRGENVQGLVTLDMNTLSVSGTPKKPGQESALEEHLKGERWFDVATYQTATVEVISMRRGVADRYDVVARLTMHGQTNEITFPATVVTDTSGRVVASAEFEIDRTKWGITAGSGSFFDDLADNVVDDMIKISFTLVAESVVEESAPAASVPAEEEDVME